jgi:hypothetical protein
MMGLQAGGTSRDSHDLTGAAEPKAVSAILTRAMDRAERGGTSCIDVFRSAGAELE